MNIHQCFVFTVNNRTWGCISIVYSSVLATQLIEMEATEGWAENLRRSTRALKQHTRETRNLQKTTELTLSKWEQVCLTVRKRKRVRVRAESLKEVLPSSSIPWCNTGALTGCWKDLRKESDNTWMSWTGRNRQPSVPVRSSNKWLSIILSSLCF